MTPSQLLEKVRDLLGEHAVGWVLALEVPSGAEDGTRFVFDYSPGSGSLTTALGLCKRLSRRLEWQDGFVEEMQEAEDEDDEGPQEFHEA